MTATLLPLSTAAEALPANVHPFPVPDSAPAPDSRARLEALVARAVRCRLDADALRASVERELTAVRERHQPSLERAEAAARDAREAVRAWSDAHRDEAFGVKKSLHCLHATVGYRSKPPRVERLRRGTDWTAIAAGLRRQPWAAAYVRLPEPVPELNKEALITDRRKLPPGALAHAGLRVVEGEEQFFLKLNETPVAAASPVADGQLAAAPENTVRLQAVG